MAKKNHNKLFIPLFLLIILSSGGLAVLSFPFSDLDESLFQFASATHIVINGTNATHSSPNVLTQSPFNVTSYDQVYDESLICPPNFFLIYNEIQHELDVNNNRYVCIRFSPIGADETNFTYISVVDEVKIGRSQSANMIQIGEGRFESKLGLTTWIQDNQEDWVERIVNDNVNGTQFESGIFSYYYDKDACGMSVFDVGRISDEYSIPKIKYNGWLVKQALNGTDTWTDLPVNSEQCDVSVIDDNDHTMITAVRNDTNGILTETYDIPKPINEMKTTLTYVNNDVSKNGTHKFAFTNVLNDVPKHMTILLKNQTSFNATSGIVDYMYQHYSSSPNAVPLDYDVNNLTYINGTIDIPRSDFYIYDVSTSHRNETGSLTLGFEMHYYSEDKQKDDRFSYYFIKDSIDKIWNIKLYDNPVSGQNDIYIDYMNNATAVNLGESVTLDPSIVSALTIQDIKLVTMEGQDFGTAGCSFQPTFNFVTSITGFGWRYDHFGAGSPNNRNTDCTSSLLTYDISSIPDLASVEQIEFKYNITTASFPFQWTNRWAVGFTEPVAVSLTGADVARTVFNCLSSGAFCVGGDTSPENINFVFNQAPFATLASPFGQCNTVAGGSLNPSPCPFVSTFIDPNAVTDFFETRLESGNDLIIMITCSLNTAFLEGSGGGCARRALSELNFARIWFADPATKEFNWTHIILTPTSEPLNVVCTNQGASNLVNWDLPLDLGGGLLQGYQIERNTGAGFVVIVADTLSALPTQFLDSDNIIAGISFTYRITAINDQGLGVPSDPSNSCGVPEEPSAPFGLTAQNAALNIVGLNWFAPLVDGNSPILNYQINRTLGSVAPPNAIWDFREQKFDANPALFTFVATGSTLEIDDGVNSAGTGYVFKVFDNTDIIGKTLAVTWSTDSFIGAGTGMEIKVFDGSYDRTSLTDFPTGAEPLIKGGGLLHTFSRTANFGTITDGFLMTLVGSTLPQVTVMVRNDDLSPTTQNFLNVDQIEIVDFNRWTFDSGTSVNLQVTGTDNDSGTVTAGTNTFTSTNPEGFIILVDNTGDTTLEFLDTTVVVDTQFGYRILARNAEGNSPFSNVAIVLTVGLPPAPILDTVTATSTSEITVDWSEPDVGDSTVQGYRIDRKIGVGGIFQTIDPFTNSQATILNDQLLAAGTEYCYRLKIFTNIGESVGFSNELCSTTFDQADPPANLLAVAIDGSTINVSWDTPPDDGGSAITGYKIERQKETDPFQILFAERQPESNRILNDTQREVGTTYTYRVSGITGFGQGETATAQATTDATPQVPQNFACSPASSTAINLFWTTPVTFSAPTGYQIDRAPFGGSFSTLVADTGTTETTFLDDGGLPLATKFSYKILAHTAEGDTDFTSIITCSTLTAPDFPPANTRGDFSEVVPHQTVLAWDIPETFGIPITEFRVERDDGAGYSTIGSVSGSSNAFIDQALDNDIAQRYRIITVGTAGESVPSIAVPFDANQTSHWHYENTIDDTGFNKNSGTVFGVVNFNGTGHIGKGFTFDGLTRIEVDSSQESDYDFENDQAFGVTSYYSGTVGSSPSPFNDEWQLREQQQISLGSVAGSFTVTPPTLSEDLISSRGVIHVFKVFNKSDIIGKTLDITWAGSFTGVGIDNRIHVLDGSYDRTNSTDFPPNDGLGFTNPLKGAGQLHFVNRFATFGTTTDSIVMTLAGSTESQITISISNRIGAGGTSVFTDITKVEIVGVDSWEWDSSASVTMAVTGTNGDFGVTNANFTNNLGAGVDEVIVSKAQTLLDIGYKFYIDLSNGNPSVKLTNTAFTDEIFVQAPTNVTDNTLHFIGFGYNGNGTASGITMNVDGTPITPTIITDTLTGTILNNEPLTIGGTSTGTNQISAGTLDETRIFGTGSLDDEQLDEIAEDELNTTAPINATMTIAGSTFANISGELVTIQLISGFPIPVVGTISLDNFTATEVNSVIAVGTIDPITGQFVFDRFFNVMGSLSNYTADTTLTNTLEAFPLLSNFDIQNPVFTFLGDFFFQQARNPTFDILSFNFTSTQQPFDLTCNLKSELFSNGTTFVFTDVFFIQTLFDVPPQTDVVVACIDPSLPVIDPTAPSFGGSNSLLSFVSFGGNTGIGNFLQFTANYGDFFGAGLPFLFIIILAAAFTGRSAPTGIIIIGVCLGAMWFLGIIEQDPVMWGIIIVLIVLGALGGKKFL